MAYSPANLQDKLRDLDLFEGITPPKKLTCPRSPEKKMEMEDDPPIRLFKVIPLKRGHV